MAAVVVVVVPSSVMVTPEMPDSPVSRVPSPSRSLKTVPLMVPGAGVGTAVAVAVCVAVAVAVAVLVDVDVGVLVGVLVCPGVAVGQASVVTCVSPTVLAGVWVSKACAL